MTLPPPGPVEREVLDSLFRGLSAKVIARARGVAPRTVEHHMERLIERTGAHNIRGAIYTGLREGWIAPPAREEGER